jgi:hypothetical protein
MEINECKLCGVNTQLCKSHIIPKFIYKYIKETSATSFIRNLSNPNVRKQDGNKCYLLCKNCENKFSIYENLFAKKHFQPAINASRTEITYENELFYFVCSVFWRFIVVSKNRYKDTIWYNDLVICEQQLKNFLLNFIYPIDYDKYYLMPVDYISNAPKEYKKLNQYFTRQTQCQIIYGDDYCFFFFQMPFFIFICNIYGLSDNDFLNSKINPINGIFITKTMTSKSEKISTFIQSNINEIENITISDNQQNIIEKDILKNIEKLYDKKAFEAIILDIFRDNN